VPVASEFAVVLDGGCLNQVCRAQSRFTGRRMFLVAMVWTFAHEVRVFSAYPELLVVDGKMNTNKSRLEYFLGVGIERMGQ
jgi:hypothetical protein